MKRTQDVRQAVTPSLSNPAIPVAWRDKIAWYLARGHKRRALRFLDTMMDTRWPLFRDDPTFAY